jgi:hypothetical protein
LVLIYYIAYIEDARSNTNQTNENLYIYLQKKKRAFCLMSKWLENIASLPLCTKSSHNMHVLMVGYWPVTITSRTFSYRVTSNTVCIQLLESLRYVIVDPLNSYVGILFYYVWDIFSNLKFHIPSIKLIHFGVTYIPD